VANACALFFTLCSYANACVVVAVRCRVVAWRGARRAVGAAAVKKEIGAGLALGFVVGGVWWVWAKGQGRKMDKWNEKLRASKGQ
jgi:hypothetical protein